MTAVRTTAWPREPGRLPRVNPTFPAKPIRWTPHALAAPADRGIDRVEAERTVAAPEHVVPAGASRHVYMRRYFDGLLGQEMLLRVVVEETTAERSVVTIYKTSKLRKYLKGLVP
jgi:hypothetical protein